MKKLMKTVAAAAVALVASSSFASLPSPTDPVGFDALTAGTKYTVSEFVERTDAGETSGSRYWYAITNASQEASAELATINNDSAQGNYLTIEAQAPLYRTINASGDFGPELSADAEEIPASGIYLDTMVKFSVSSDEFKDGDLDTADKLAITCYSADDSGVTNIIVRAGYVGSSVVATNYVMTLPANFDVDAWHQLTVRAIADVGSSTAPVGFAVYLDQVLLTYGTEVAAGDSDYVGALNAAVTQNLYKEGTHALLPSLVTTGVNKSKLTAVGFKGTGSLDDIQFTNAKPSFIEEGTAVSIAWDAGVATYTVVDNNNKTLVDAAATSGAAGSTNLTLDAGVTTLTVTAMYANGYEAGEWTVTGDGAQISGSTFTVANGAELSIVSMLPKFDVGGTRYDSFEAALDAAVKAGTSESPATVKLLAACNQVLGFTEGYVILDLNGCDVQGGDDADCSIVNSGATLVITNSGDEASVKLPTNPLADPAITLMTAAGQTTIQAGTFDGLVIPGDGENILTVITGGKFLDAGDEFYLAECVASGLTYSKSGDYVIIGAAQPELTKIDVPTAASNLVYDGTEKTGVAAGEGYTLSGDFKATNAGEHTATATPATGYSWSDGSTEATNIVWSIAKASVTATVSLTVTEATYDSGKTSVTDYTTPSVNFGPDAPVLVENTDYTVAWSTTEVTGAGTFTYTVSPVAGGNCTFTETSATLTITAGGEYPTYIDPSDTETKAKYDTWKETYGADTGSAYEDAFLLNCAPADVETAKANFKATITVNADGTVTVTAPGDYNVTPTIQGKQTLSNTEEWHPKAEGDKFFRAVLEL